jgi:hypothetical protein
MAREKTTQRESWRDVFRSAGDAFLEVLRAEWAVVVEHWKESGLRLGVLAGLAGFAFFLLFWLAGLVVMGVVALLSSLFEWQLWQAAFATALGLLLFIAILGLVAWVVGRRLENPVSAFQVRVQDHYSWWQEAILGEERQLAGPSSSADQGGSTKSRGDDDAIEG